MKAIKGKICERCNEDKRLDQFKVHSFGRAKICEDCAKERKQNLRKIKNDQGRLFNNSRNY